MLKKTFYLLLASTLILACKKEEPAPNSTTNLGTGPSSDNLYISAKIDGNAWYVENTVNEYYHGTGHNASVASNGDISLDYNSSITQFEPTPNPPVIGTMIVGLSGFFTNLGPYSTNDDIFTSHFTVGSKPYFANGSSTSGAEIQYYDANETEWSTRYGDQSGSTFNLTSASNTALNGSNGKLSKATFSCKLYMEGDHVNFKTVTEGSFYVIFDKYQ